MGEIITILKERYPKLFDVLVELTQEHEEHLAAMREAKAQGRIKQGYTMDELQNISDEEKKAISEVSTSKEFGVEQFFYFGKAFEVMVPMAKELDPHYDTDALTY